MINLCKDCRGELYNRPGEGMFCRKCGKQVAGPKPGPTPAPSAPPTPEDRRASEVVLGIWAEEAMRESCKAAAVAEAGSVLRDLVKQAHSLQDQLGEAERRLRVIAVTPDHQVGHARDSARRYLESHHFHQDYRASEALHLLRRLAKEYDNHKGSAYCEMGVDMPLLNEVNAFLAKVLDPIWDIRF